MQAAVADKQVNREEFSHLTPEQERQLAMACARGDEEAIKKLVSANLPLVVSVAKDYKDSSVPLMDLIQEGSVGLLIAARKFDYTLENRFSTYAVKVIRHCICRYIRSQGNLIRVPDHTYYKIRQVLEAQAALRQQGGGEPTLEEIANAAQLDKSKVEKLLQLWPEIFSLDATLQMRRPAFRHF